MAWLSLLLMSARVGNSMEPPRDDYTRTKVGVEAREQEFQDQIIEQWEQGAREEEEWRQGFATEQHLNVQSADNFPETVEELREDTRQRINEMIGG